LIKGSKLVSDVDCYLTGHLDNGLIIIEGRPMPDVSIQECIDFIWQELDRLKNEEINNRELQKVKNKVVSSIAMSDLSILNKAMSMSYFEYIGLIDKMNEQEEIYEAVTKEEVQFAARKYLNKSNLSVLNYLPKEKMAQVVN
jgi:predicted Zn-dependent peptidase